MHCPQDYWPIEDDKSKDQKKFEAKKTPNNSITNQNSGSNSNWSD